MSPQKLKKTLQLDLRAKRNKNRRARLVAGLALVGLSLGIALFVWHKQRPAALLQLGIRLEQQGRIAEALEAYRALHDGYPETTAAEDALYRSGQILQHDLGDAQLALLNYLLLEKDYPQSDHIRAARQAAAELTKFRLDDCGQAIPIYQRLIETGGENADRSLYEIADCYVRQENWRQAAIEFETLLSNYPESSLGGRTRFRLSDALLLSGRRKEARQGFELLVKEAPQSELAEEARFRLAEMLEEEERLQEALRAYSQLTHFPRQDLLKQKILRLKERMARKKKVL